MPGLTPSTEAYRFLDHDPDPQVFQNARPFSSQSSDLNDFEVYNRRNLPRLVEARLTRAVNIEVAPIEERLRTFVVDIVRDCQATVARDFELLNNQTAATGVPIQASFYETNLSQVAEGESRGREGGTGGVADTHGSNIFVEPPHLNEDMITSVPVASYHPNQDTTLARTSDSGIGSFSSSCGCPCHFTGGLTTTLYGRYSFDEKV